MKHTSNICCVQVYYAVKQGFLYILEKQDLLLPKDTATQACLYFRLFHMDHQLESFSCGL